jgi:hypothetical protein
MTAADSLGAIGCFTVNLLGLGSILVRWREIARRKDSINFDLAVNNKYNLSL